MPDQTATSAPPPQAPAAGLEGVIVAESEISYVDGEAGKLVYEVADLWFHTLVLLANFGLGPDDVVNELARREGLSGLEEKARRKEEG